MNCRRLSHSRQQLAVFCICLVALAGVVTPFAFGSNDVGTVLSKQTQLSSLHRASPPSVSALHTTLSTSPAEPKLRIRSILSKFSLSSGRANGRWKGGESKASIPSRLLFRYVSPLLDLAGDRNLNENDAFPIPDSQSMETSVETLASHYAKARAKSQKKVELQRQKGDEKVKNSQTNTLFRALLRQNRNTLLLTGMLRLSNTLIQAFPAILVARLLRGIEAGNSVPARHVIQSALLLVSVLLLKMINENQFFHNVVGMSTRTRGSLEGLIFDKSLRLPEGGSGILSKRTKKDNKQALGAGGVLNLLQTDATKIESAMLQIHTTWDGPLQIALYTSLLYRYVGSSMFWGLGVLLSIIPLNTFTLWRLERLTRLEDEARDNRIKRTNESIKNMKLLKLQGWEKEFEKDISQHREEELTFHKQRGVIRAINSSITNTLPALVLVVTLTAYVKAGRPIEASVVFTAISLFNQLRFPLFFFPMLIDSIVNGKNALRRISSYLTSEEIVPYVEKTFHRNEGGSIEMKNGNFLWATSQSPKDGQVTSPESPALCNANMKVNPGEVVALVGISGSGKSALVKGLLGELAPVPRAVVDKETDAQPDNSLMDRPSVRVNGHIAYCSQEAWLPKGTIRDAITFGREFDQDRYDKAVYDAGLDKDITSDTALKKASDNEGSLSHQTEVGEGGSNLSGGQRARVALARALYSDDDTKVFLLDDCLAALDATVGSMVFERLTRRFREAKIAAVIVTNDPSLPRRCDRVVLMGPTDKDNKSPTSTCSTVVDSGTYDELLRRGHNLQSFSSSDEEVAVNSRRDLGEDMQSDEPTGHEAPGIEELQSTLDGAGQFDDKKQEDQVHSNPIVSEPNGDDDVSATESKAMGNNNTQSPQRMLSTDDKMSTEAVPLSTYKGYLKAVKSPKLIITMMAMFLASTGSQFFQQYTVAKWTDLAHGESMATALGGRYLQSLVYAAGATSVFLWLRTYFTMLVGTRASKFYHDRMVSSVFRAPMSFFDTTPSGQLLSRFGKEVGIVDRQLPDSFAAILFCGLQIGSSMAALAGAISPTMMIPLTLVGSMYVKKIQKFRPAARDMKRTETSTRSPIFTHFGEALRGTEIIRSIPGAPRTWSTEHRKLADRNLSVYSTVKSLDRWLSCNLESLGNFVVFMAAMASVALARAGRLQPGAAGWGLTQSLAITGLVAWAVRNLTALEANMMSVMRVSEITDLREDASSETDKAKFKMPRELSGPGEAIREVLQTEREDGASLVPVSEDALKDSGWPWTGNISFKRAAMRYNPGSPLVLKGIDLDVPAGTTLGVVGRTGSGKSSLLLTLFRIVEIEPGGSIEIDGIDIRSVSIQTLRNRLSIIPQDPVLFAGTVRYNLDALGESSSEDMWAVLEAASPELARQFRTSGGLDTPISEGGTNLSQGQRQLICLARALLKRSKVLVLDEATSSVDASTDRQVQNTIRREFVEKGVSVITVAHRLDTVLGYDNIAVLGDGELLELGKPADLLNIPNGELRRLVDADRVTKRKGGRRTELQAVTA